MSVKAEGAMDRVKTYIALGSGKTDLNNLDANSLTLEELQFLGIYLSNYFIPFRTDVGLKGDEKTISLKKDMVNNLKSVIGMNDKIAEQVGGYLFSMIRSSSKELKVGFSKNNPTATGKSTTIQNNVKLANGKTTVVNPSYATLLGGTFSSKETYIRLFGLDPAKDPKYRYMVFYINQGGTTQPVYVADMFGEEVTPSVFAFIKGLQGVGIKDGYGLSLLDLAKKQIEEPTEAFLKEVIEKTEGKKTEGYTIYGTKLRVDCFGNLLCMGSNNQYIIMNGATNPFTWQVVDSRGNDVVDLRAGKVLNLTNTLMLDLYSRKDLLTSSGKYEVRDRKNQKHDYKLGKGTIDFSTFYNNANKVSIERGRGAPPSESVALTIARGFSKMKADDPIFKKSSVTKLVEGAGYLEDKNAIAREGAYYKDSWGKRGFAAIRNSDLFINGAKGKNIIFTNSYALIDDLGAFGWGKKGTDDKDAIDYEAINFQPILDNYDVNKGVSQETSKFIGELVENMKSKDAFSSNYEKIKEGGMVNVDATMFSKVSVSMYITYAYASFWDESADGKAKTIGKVGFRLNKEGLPTPQKGSFELDKEAKQDLQLQTIRNWVYYLLHPTGGVKYTTTLLKTITNGAIVGLHEDIVGSRGTGIMAGTTKYKSSFGMISLPEVEETEWMSGAMKIFKSLQIYLILAAIIVAVVYWAIGVLELKHAIKGLAITMAVLLLIPTVLSRSITWSNNIIAAPYSSRFNHWALAQHQTYSKNIDEAIGKGSYTGYLRTLNKENLGQNQGSDPVNVKWQAPKKMASLVLNNNDAFKKGSNLDKMLKPVINRAYSGEGYTGDPNSVYMFRSYLDLANVSRFMYGSLSFGYRKFNENPNTRLWDKDLQAQYNNMDKNLEEAKNNGYLNSSDGELQYRIKAMLGAKPYNDALSQKGTIKDLSTKDLVGISPDAFNFSIPFYTAGSSSWGTTISGSVEEEMQKMYEGSQWTDYKNYNTQDIASLGIYGVMSESPFYYFAFSLYDQGLDPTPGASGGYKNLVLKKNNAGYFYNNETKGNGLGEMKDFLDMRGLFTYVIPYLRQGNDIVREWDEVYGIKLYDGVSTKEEDLNDDSLNQPENAELKQKTWHNVNVARLYSIYTPWVDLLYDSKYAKPEVVNVMGERKEIKDPLNPASYPKNRPMIFSRSEMVNLGYKEGDLTKVEKKILAVQDKAQERMFDLLDYYSFNDNVVDAAVAMELTFIFNREFSDMGVFNTNGVVLYPQNFEMTDFSNDAYLRLILSNSTGDTLYENTKKGFYMDVVENSSTLVGVMLIIVDIACEYVLPIVKVITLIGLVILAFLLGLTIILKLKDKPWVYASEHWVLPLFKFLASTILFSYAVALLMPVGTGNISGSKISIQLGDPAVAMGVVVLLVGVMCYVYYKIMRDILRSVRDTSFGIGALFVATAASVVGKAGNLGKGVTGGIGNIVQEKKQATQAENTATRRNSDLARKIAEEQEKVRNSENNKKKGKKDTNINNPSSKNDGKSKKQAEEINKAIKQGRVKLSKKSVKNKKRQENKE